MKTIWILTTGSSDVQLKTKGSWSTLFRNVRSQFKDLTFSPFRPEYADASEPFSVPARVMGMVYGQQLDEKYYEDLYFPLLDAFEQKLSKNSKTIPDRIIVILTDQEAVFDEKERRQRHRCPYWQDTCTLEPILEKYLQNKFPKAEQKYIPLKPQSKEGGLDNWDAALRLIQKAFSDIEFDKMATVYVSHQAGTPAISSAVQFVSLAKFGKRVSFLVSNEYEQKPAELMESSEYLRGIQVQQAKGLIKSGTPGAALQLLELEGIKANLESQSAQELEKLVNFFNLKSSLTDGKGEFDIEAATQRIVDALELIRILFKQNNYLLGIALLAAAQETFLKIAILSKVASISERMTIEGCTYQVFDLIEWMKLGLSFSSKTQGSSDATKRQILNKLKFPTNRDLLLPNKNFFLREWLENLEPDFQSWSLLKWSCKKDRDNDLRNQLMHNLQGMETTEVSQYLTGDAPPSDPTNVVKTYDDWVKVPFLKEIQRLGLKYTRNKLDKKLQDLADSLR